MALQWNLGRRDRQWQPLRSHPEQEPPDREHNDDSCAPRPASAAVQLSQRVMPDDSRAPEPHDQQQQGFESEFGSGERQPLVGWDEGPPSDVVAAASQPATQSALTADAPVATVPPLGDLAAVQAEEPSECPDGSIALLLKPVLPERAREAPGRMMFVRAESAPAATVDAAAAAAVSAASTAISAVDGNAHETLEESQPPAAAQDLATQRRLQAAGLDLRPSRPLEAGLGHDRLAIRTSVPAAAGDGAFSSKDGAAGASTSATAGGESPVIRCALRNQ